MRGYYDKSVSFSVNRTTAYLNTISTFGSVFVRNDLYGDRKSTVMCKPSYQTRKCQGCKEKRSSAKDWEWDLEDVDAEPSPWYSLSCWSYPDVNNWIKVKILAFFFGKLTALVQRCHSSPNCGSKVDKTTVHTYCTLAQGVAVQSKINSSFFWDSLVSIPWFARCLVEPLQAVQDRLTYFTDKQTNCTHTHLQTIKSF